MRLTLSPQPHFGFVASPLRRRMATTAAVFALGGLLAPPVQADPSATVLAASDAPKGTSTAAAATNGSAEPSKDLLGNMVVVAGAARSLPKVGVVPSLSADIEDVLLRSVLRRDLDLCGEVEVLSEDSAPSGLYLEDSPVDTKAWEKKGAEAIVRVSATKVGANVELFGQLFLASTGAAAVFEKKITVAEAKLRSGAHKLSDLLIGALTGHDGGFASRLTFAAGTGKTRQIQVIDADGFGARAISQANETPVSPAFGKDGEVYYAASQNSGHYHLRSENGNNVPIAITTGTGAQKRSVYGIAFSKDRKNVAVSIGSGPFIRLFQGADLDHLTQASNAPFAMEPTYTPSGKLAFVGLGNSGQRIFVDDKPVTPDGIFAMSPTFCNHPDGIRLVFAAGSGLATDLYATSEKGGALVRLTQDQGENSSPACSPDGRLVAFFSTRKTGDGPGLYVMRLDGLRPKRVSTLAGDSLRWDVLPPL